jgi:DNA-binding NarL/FixJ family response regulator
MTTKTVLVAEDHALARTAIRAALDSSSFHICAEAIDADSAIEAAQATRPDVCLLDIYMPGSGIRAAGEILRVLPGTAIVMLTGSDSDDDLFAALKAGAVGYLLKDIDPMRLPAALEGVLAGEAAIPRALVARLVGEFRRRTGTRRTVLRGNRRVELTEREWDVLELLRAGLTTKGIAGRLSISPVTVRRHLSETSRKLQVTSRRDLLQILA